MSVRRAVSDAPPLPELGRRYGLAAVLGVAVFALLNLVPIAVVNLLPGRRPSLSMWVPAGVLALGVATVAAGVLLYRATDRDARLALGVVLAGLVLATWGGDGLIQFSAVGIPGAQSRPAITGFYRVIDIVLGLAVMLGSLLVGVWRWPTRPSYAVLGALLGAWLFYPAVYGDVTGVDLLDPGYLVGVLLVFAVPVLVAYILRRDAAPVIRRALAFPTARYVGAAVTAIAAAYFSFSTGMLSNIPDQSSTGTLSWTHAQWATSPVVTPVVEWPAVEYWLPHLPLAGFVSVGMVVLVGTVSVLLGVLGAITAASWVSRGGRDGVSGTLAGLGALAGPNACCCCGPIIPQVAVLFLGPSAASPLFWTFVQPTSPIGVSFLVASILLITGSILSATAE